MGIGIYRCCRKIQNELLVDCRRVTITDFRASKSVWLPARSYVELSSIAQSRSLPAGYVFCAKLILMLAEGASFNTITAAPDHRTDHRSLEAALFGLRPRWPRHLPSRSDGQRTDPGCSGPDSVGYP